MSFWCCKIHSLNQTSTNILKIIIYNQEVASSGLIIGTFKSWWGLMNLKSYTLIFASHSSTASLSAFSKGSLALYEGKSVSDKK